MTRRLAAILSFDVVRLSFGKKFADEVSWA
jgi:hypothetical protein